MSSREAVTEILTTAQEIIVEMKLEADLRAPAFSKAVDLLAAGVTAAAPSPSRSGQRGSSHTPSAPLPPVRCCVPCCVH